ncbi:MAG TPA: ferrous iron transport protein B [Candidatus Desulfofervidus auxilii]|uniref:Ferrous iron transport protein B n=1 Tax=Desulfofervidus auxilii TaxID=1621989 RepID=A0A7V0NE65_DESA2|nr:ferrous iron transport protein B [Candidatus Desulfofervidus auxilii]
MKFVLVGQPNCGKSTIFNYISGYKAVTANFPGTTVKYTASKLYINGNLCECVDLPGTYSLIAADAAEEEARRYLLTQKIDVIINVVDASILSRGLELTLELLELCRPMVVALNMVDEAEKKGIHVDDKKLANILKVPVVKTIAYTGQGLTELLRTALMVYKKKIIGVLPVLSKDVEDVVMSVVERVKDVTKGLNIPPRFLALKLLERDHEFENIVLKSYPELSLFVKEAQKKLEEGHGRPPDVVVSSERHALAMHIYEKVVKILRIPKPDIRDRIDDVLMHRFAGYIFLFLIFYIFFNLIFKIGSHVEEPLMNLFDILLIKTKSLFPSPLVKTIVEGAIQGIAGGVAIVLPYLVPFFIGLALLEDSGYLPRVAFLLDSFMHRIGLHGKSVIPLLLGYGCSVPAVMATRVLESERDRFITATLSTLIPCSARTVIILGLVSYYLGPNYALGLYVVNIFVVGISGKVLTYLYPEITPGLILEVPKYHLPSFRSIFVKSWYRIKEFIIIAWPILIIGSIILSILQFFHLDNVINTLCSPVTFLLGLPTVVGTTLIFGILRKELSLIMLLQALGTKEVLYVMTKGQILTFTVFVIFYIPCLATIAALWREIGARKTIFAILFTTFIALLLGILTRGISSFL